MKLRGRRQVQPHKLHCAFVQCQRFEQEHEGGSPPAGPSGRHKLARPSRPDSAAGKKSGAAPLQDNKVVHCQKPVRFLQLKNNAVQHIMRVTKQKNMPAAAVGVSCDAAPLQCNHSMGHSCLASAGGTCNCCAPYPVKRGSQPRLGASGQSPARAKTQGCRLAVNATPSLS